ncbi:Zn(2)-C6 fungal-type DNA-binding domain protein [Akanthomyces lecanii RCEF 1005]|uniref:Zn(2)-C6 fungal-type DNA-binding domain protein n=1 Tax=Akanthomyces lecanii RCEF 1005 TaxID=1081108 RepID=A0A162IVY1_CORDF|nr:Zn(2)-C6 fungal-type DNA-binding domain protein [Akanthomyces lecanii RCEF 1005]
MRNPPATLRHKFRKGTHSCGECRRRKLKCTLSPESTVCTSCQRRGIQCIPQEMGLPVAKAASNECRSNSSGVVVLQKPKTQPERLEKQANKVTVSDRCLASSVSPDSPADAVPRSVQASLPSSSDEQTWPARQSQCSAGDASFMNPDVLGRTVAHNAKVVTALEEGGYFDGTLTSSIPSLRQNFQTSAHHDISARLCSFLPPKSTASILLTNGPSVFLDLFNSSQHFRNLQKTDHPALVANRLMMLALCLQQLPSSFDQSSLVFQPALATPNLSSRSRGSVVICTWVEAVSCLVSCNDNLISNAEGLEALILQATVQADGGHLRKAWMTGRKAISMAVMLGLHLVQPNSATFLSSCIPGEVVSSQMIDSLWFRCNCIDRYASLVLGLPPASNDLDFASEARMQDNTANEYLGKTYAVCSGRICERNEKLAAGHDGRALTEEIEIELEHIAHFVDDTWWDSPSLCVAGTALSDELMVLNLQVRYYTLTVMLQLPYMLQQKAGQYPAAHERSCKTCMQACRSVIHRFVRFRNIYKSSTTGRQIDYAALLSCMALLQGHIVLWRQARQSEAHSLQPLDEELVDTARQTMQHIGVMNENDTLSCEFAKTISNLLAYLRSYGKGNNGGLDSYFAEPSSRPKPYISIHKH